MATKTFGSVEPTEQKRPEAELFEHVGVEFPLTLRVAQDGTILGASYETTWKTGGTEPKEQFNKKTKETETVYVEDYKDHKLTADQVKKIDAWLKERVVTPES